LANLPKLADDTTSINQEVFINAFIKAMKNDSLALQISKEDATVLLQEFFADLRQAEMDRMKAKAIRNKLSADSILNANRSQEGAQVTESGLQYKVITMGTGAKPTAEDVVRVNYVGKLADGTVFDSSIERGRPAEFPVGAVITGWSEALKMMPVGSKWELVIPSELAYGEQGAGELIEPNSVLFFEVELLDIIKK
jgi:FKBP-type peptidyl-prolyl cis-trans isomerase FklB